MKFLPIVLALVLSAIATDSALACGGPCSPPPPKKHHSKPIPVPPPPAVVVTPAPTPAPVVTLAPVPPAPPAASAPAPQPAPYEAKNPSLYEYCVWDHESGQMQKRRTTNTTPPGPAPVGGICVQATSEPIEVSSVLPLPANGPAGPPVAILRHPEPPVVPEPQPDVAVLKPVAVEPESEDLPEVVNVGDGTAAEEWAE